MTFFWINMIQYTVANHTQMVKMRNTKRTVIATTLINKTIKYLFQGFLKFALFVAGASFQLIPHSSQLIQSFRRVRFLLRSELFIASRWNHFVHSFLSLLLQTDHSHLVVVDIIVDYLGNSNVMHNETHKVTVKIVHLWEKWRQNPIIGLSDGDREINSTGGLKLDTWKNLSVPQSPKFSIW